MLFVGGKGGLLRTRQRRENRPEACQSKTALRRAASVNDDVLQSAAGIRVLTCRRYRRRGVPATSRNWFFPQCKGLACTMERTTEVALSGLGSACQLTSSTFGLADAVSRVTLNVLPASEE